jgi:very-short-patch-repair endonuclease
MDQIDAADQRVAEIATGQDALITRDQALGAGLTRGAIEERLVSGRWRRVHASVYLINGAPPTWRQKVRAACLAAGPDAATSHVTAAVLLGILTIRDAVIELTAPFRKHPRNDGYIVHRSRLGTGPVVLIDGIPATNAARTLLDLATRLTRNRLEEAFDASIRLKLTTGDEVQSLIDSVKGSGRRGVRVLQKVLDERTPGGAAANVFETRMRQVMRDGGLPTPTRQYEIRVGGHIIGIADLCYPAERVVIEFDGYADRANKRSFVKDRRRQNALVQAGWIVLRFTWDDLARPRYIHDTIRRVLFERGHADVVSLSSSTA